jgi:predicted short-subunit dehydrogenase-like oxidoreductase (DUF2520 family)
MGLSLAAAFARSGEFDEVIVCGRHPEPPEHPVFAEPGVRYVFGLVHPPGDTVAVLLALPDEAVPDVAYHLGELGDAPEGCAAFHLSGALPTDVLEPLYHRGYGVGAFHPLVVLTDPLRAPQRFAGAYAAVTAAPAALRTARVLGDAIGTEVFAVPAVRRPVYHAAVTLVQSGIVPLVAHAAELLEHSGIDADDALEAVVALARGTLTGLEEGGVGEATVGVLSRGDAETVSVHLRALEEEDQRRYAVLGRELLRLADEAARRDPRLAGDAAAKEMSERRREVERLLARHTELETTGAGAGS